jgi:hypothetical protein
MLSRAPMSDRNARRRPTIEEHAPYFERYIGLVPETDIVSALDIKAALVERWPARVTPEKEDVGYAAGKWTPRQVMGHLTDTERVFAYRALRISRLDLTPLPGFDQDPFVAHSPDADVPFQALVDEFVMLRRANLPLFRRLDDAAWSAIGSSSHAPLSARAAAYIMVGHVRHHATLFRDRYGLMLEA